MDTSTTEAAMRASAAATADPSLGSVTFRAEDFPSVSGMGTNLPLGTWGAATSGVFPAQHIAACLLDELLLPLLRNQQRWRWPRCVALLPRVAATHRQATPPPATPPVAGAGPSSRAAPRAEDFPALPSLSKSAKKRQKEKEKRAAAAGGGSGGGPSSLAERVGARAAQPRVLNVAAPGLRGSASASALAAAAAGSPVEDADSSSDGDGEAGGAGPSGLPPPPAAGAAGLAGEAFPALGPAAVPAHPSWVPVRSRAPRPGARGGGGGGAPTPAPAPQLRGGDFPSLAAATPAAPAPAAARSPARPQSAGGGAAQRSAAAPSVEEAVAAAGGVSAGLKEANRVGFGALAPRATPCCCPAAGSTGMLWVRWSRSAPSQLLSG